MADPNFKKISDMAALTTAAADDIIPIVDVSEPADADKNKKITAANLRKDIKTAEMLNAQVTSDKLANDSVIAGKIATGGVSASAQLAAQVVDTSALKDANVTAAKLATDAVETAKIKNAQVTAGKLATDAVETAKIKNLNVTTDKLAAEAVTHPKIKGLGTPPADDDRIAFWDYSASSLGYLDLGTGLAISGTTLNAANIGSGDIADGAVTNAKLGSDVGVWTAWTPTVTGWATSGLTKAARYALINNVLHFEISIAGTSNGATATATPPFTSLEGGTMLPQQINSYAPVVGVCEAYGVDNGVVGLVYYADSKLNFYRGTSSAGWATSGSKIVIARGTISFMVP